MTRLVRVADGDGDLWLAPNRVEAVSETCYPGPPETWRTSIMLHNGRGFTIEGRAAAVVAALNEEELR